MSVGVSGYVEFDSSVSWGKVRVYYSETYDILTNKSKLTITSIQVKSTNYYGYTYYPDGVLKINGMTVLTLSSLIGDTLVRVDKTGTWYKIVSSSSASTVITASLDGILHNTDGSKSVEIQLTGNRFTGFNFFTVNDKGGSGWSVNTSKSVTLTTIPRASEIGATDANIGSTSTIIIDKKATEYTHSVAYKFGSLTGYITSSGGVSSAETKFSTTSVAFKVPTAFYAQIPNKKNGVCTLTIKTYSGQTQIGEAQTCEFTAVAAESNCAPSVSGTVVDSNEDTIALTGDPNLLVRYMSTALCTLSAEAKNGASISTKKIGGAVISGDTRSIPSISADSVYFQATDSRGYSKSSTVKFTRIDYVKLTSNPSVERTDPTSGNAVLFFKGSYFNGSFGASVNSLKIRYKVGDGDYLSISPTLSGNSYSAEASLSGLDYRSSHQVTVIVEDALMSLSTILTVRQGIPVVDWGAEDFRINVFLRLLENSYGVTPPGTGKKGQLFFELQPSGGYIVRIHDGSSWV